MCSDTISDLYVLTATSRESPLRNTSKTRNFLKNMHFFREEKLISALTCMGVTQSICCRDNKNHPYQSGHWCLDICGVGIFLIFLSTPLKSLNLFFSTLCVCVYTVLLMNLSVPQIKCHQMVDLLVNNELESKWKDPLRV